MEDVRLAETEIRSCSWRGVFLAGAELSGAHLSDVKIEGMGFEVLKILRSNMANVAFRNTAYKAHVTEPLAARDFSILDSDLDGVSFIDCVLRDTTLQGVKAKGIRLRGVDLTGKTITSGEELKELGS